ncbi:MAG: hypothetical protein JXP36_07715 [Bacteroidales bacterium]|nr:hypothetical protein [Bacteroidales bacterium]
MASSLFKYISDKKIDSILTLSGHFFFFILLLFSVYFYKERIFFSDSSFYFFKIVNFEKINVEAFRYGAILPEIPVLLSMKLGVGLKWLTVIYSTSFILLYYLVFLCCVYLFKNVSAGFAVIFVLILCIGQSFFHPVTETHQSLVFSVLVYAILQYSGFRYSLIQYLLATAIIILAFFAHPVAIYPLIFIIGFVAIDKKQLHSLVPYVLLFIVGGLALGKVLLTNENSYEGKFFLELLKSPDTILNLPHAYSTKFFITRIFGLYIWLAILAFILIIYFILQKEYIKLVWQLAASVFFLTITLLTYNQGDSDMLMERAFMPLSLFVVVPLFKETIENIGKLKILKFAFLTVIIIISLSRIYQQGMVFKSRMAFNKELLTKTAQFPNRKFIIPKSELDKHILTFWSYSIETLLLSGVAKDIPNQTIYSDNNLEGFNKYTTNPNGTFLGPNFWLEWKMESLNPKYFNLPVDKPYRIVSLKELGIESY